MVVRGPTSHATSSCDQSQVFFCGESCHVLGVSNTLAASLLQHDFASLSFMSSAILCDSATHHFVYQLFHLLPLHSFSLFSFLDFLQSDLLPTTASPFFSSTSDVLQMDIFPKEFHLLLKKLALMSCGSSGFDVDNSSNLIFNGDLFGQTSAGHCSKVVYHIGSKSEGFGKGPRVGIHPPKNNRGFLCHASARREALL